MTKDKRSAQAVSIRALKERVAAQARQLKRAREDLHHANEAACAFARMAGYRTLPGGMLEIDPKRLRALIAERLGALIAKRLGVGV